MAAIRCMRLGSNHASIADIWLEAECPEEVQQNVVADRSRLPEMEILFARTSECHWPQEAQIRGCRNQFNLLRIPQEELQTGMVLAVEIVMNVLGEIGKNVGFAQLQL